MGINCQVCGKFVSWNRRVEEHERIWLSLYGDLNQEWTHEAYCDDHAPDDSWKAVADVAATGRG